MRTEFRSSRTGLRSALAFAVVLSSIVFACESHSRAQTTEPAETIRVDSDLVDLKVSVVRLNPANPVSALEQKDFLVLEDGKPQEIVFFAGEDSPFDLFLLLDVSGSTSDKLKLIRSSAKRFIESTRPTDRVAVFTFSDVTHIVSPLTWDRRYLKASLKDIEEPIGGTNFWDSLFFVLEAVVPSQKAARRSAVVVMTDGVDNALPEVFGDGSQKSFAELLDKLNHSDTLVFPIYLDTEKEVVKRNKYTREAYAIARTQLAQLGESAGTKVYRANKLKDLDSVYEQVIKDLSTVYSVGYKPSNPAKDGKWRSVVVRLVGRQDLSARSKPGYYAKAN